MKIFLASDHAGFELKEKVKRFLKVNNFEVEDCGALNYNKDDDYPDFISKAAINVSKNPGSFGIVFGGSGQAEMMVANKIKGIRCGLFYGKASPIGAVDIIGRISDDPYEIVRLTRDHNNANILSIAARFVTEEEAIKATKLWLGTQFPADARHVRRIKKIKELET